MISLFAPLLLIPVCLWLNHLGGQSTAIPCPRFTCRMLGQGAAFGAISRLAGFDTLSAFILGEVAFAGFVIWAVTKWGPGFMALRLSTDDRRDYTTSKWGTNYWITRATDRLLGVDDLTRLSLTDIHFWGAVYMGIHGALLYPLFAALAYLVTPWAAIIGFGCMLQGIMYATSETVLVSEKKMGALIGLLLALVLICSMVNL